MLSFVQSWFNPASNPIGVDFGSDCLRLAQVELVDGEHRLAATASADVPPHVRNDPAARFAFFSQAVRDLLAEGNFRGRRVMLNLPASLMHIQHLRLPKMEDEALKKALAWEARGKLPFDPSQAILRHLIAGEIYHDQEPKYEVILMAARRDLIDQYLAAAAKARLQVAGMNVEPRALIDCFSHVFRRASDIESCTCFVEIGCCATRAVIARGGRILFARSIPVGGEHFTAATAAALNLAPDDARRLRVRLAATDSDELTGKSPADERPMRPAPEPAPAPVVELAEDGGGFALLNAALAAADRRDLAAKPSQPSEAAPRNTLLAPVATIGPFQDRARVQQACREPLARLCEELSLCRRYHEAAFHDQPVQRLVFLGGEANQRGLCQQIAREMGLAAQIGDPLCRMSKFTGPEIQGGLDRRVSQPAWAVAVGLSMGPLVVKAAVKATSL